MVSAPPPLILLTEAIAEPGLLILRDAGRVHVAGTTDAEQLATYLGEASALVVRSSPVTEEMLDLAPHLTVVGRHGAGLDNIDVAAAHKRAIAVVNTPGANAASVAEFVILAALALSRRLTRASGSLAAGDLHNHGSLPGAVVRNGLAGAMLDGRTLGLIGLGAIGIRAAAYAQCMGARVIATDPAVRTPPPGVTLSTLDSVLARSDVLSLHVPLVPATAHLIDADAIQKMRPDALLINTARAGVVDDAAVRTALDSGRLGGYAVDVFDPEPPPLEHPLLTHPGVLATPHMAAMTTDALDEMARSVATGVAAVLAGQIPPNQVPNTTKEAP